MQHVITSAVTRYKRHQRKGRGDSSGRGKTAGRGNKGSGARVGTYIRRGYEGGQTEIYRRFPKRGFSNFNFERKFHVVNLKDLERFDNGATVDQAALVEAGLVPDTKQPVKILGEGTLSKKLTIVAGWYSKSAHEAVTKAGGTAQNAEGQPFEFPKPKKKFVKREDAKKVGGGKKKDKGGGEAEPATGGGNEAAPVAEKAKPEKKAPPAEKKADGETAE
jgi:large subunit ribosomal protein L15